MKPLLLTAALGILAGGALAQNTKGTGAETRTTTTTNPEASVGLATPSDDGSHATRPSGTDRPNMKATKSAQDQYRKRRQKRCLAQVIRVLRMCGWSPPRRCCSDWGREQAARCIVAMSGVCQRSRQLPIERTTKIRRQPAQKWWSEPSRSSSAVPVGTCFVAVIDVRLCSKRASSGRFWSDRSIDLTEPEGQSRQRVIAGP